MLVRLSGVIIRLETGPTMSTPEAPIPKRFWEIVHWIVQNHPWIFFLVFIERMAERDYQLAVVFSAIFVANLFVASRWDEIGGYLQRRKRMLPYIALGGFGLLLFGIAIGAIWNGGISLGVAAPQHTGRIAWNFDQMDSGNANFLNLIRLNQDEIRVVGIGAHGRNTSKDPVTEFRGYARSDLTNATLPFFIMAEEPNNASAIPNPFRPAQIPMRPEDTFGIPGLADFDIVTYEQAVITQGVDGVPLSEFLREFGSFTLVLEYDGIKVERKFSSEQIKRAVDAFESSLNPQRTTSPRVTRRPTAAAPIQSVLPFPMPTPPAPSDSTKPTAK